MANARSWVSAVVTSAETRPVLLKTGGANVYRNGSGGNSARFDAFEVNFASREVRKHGLRIRLAQKPFQILELLLQEPGNVVTRKALREKLWPDTHVGYEHSLNTAVNTLRELLGDSAQNPRYIETLPRVGYRFIASVQRPHAVANKQVLVTLPFTNLTGDGSKDFFIDGLNEEITLQLGLLEPGRLGVIARTTAVLYKNTSKSVAEIALELGANYVLEGSIRGSDASLRITVQLIDAAEQSCLWCASFDCTLGDTLAIQSEIAQQIGSGVRSTLAPAVRSWHQPQHATS
jgi:TolB-like protein